jgi:Fe2+ or Zn2+ uptake regulation protein
MSFADTLSQHRRLAILKLLDESAGYTLNESLLCEAANALGIVTSRDQIRSELAWLEEQGLVARQEIAGLTIARLSARGQDAAHGRAIVPGIRRPSAKG